MNKVNLIGRITKDIELKKNSSDIPYTIFTLAVNRNFTKEDGTREADFINCVAWRKTAELMSKHFQKGSELGLSGRIQTGSYENEKGDKVYTTDVIVDEITFVGKKGESRPEPEYNGPEEETTENDPYAEYGQTVTDDNNFLE